jgi:phenylpropionate dioxygenase-like ring-hydroxylating dioxygenase large terminal subunit
MAAAEYRNPVRVYADAAHLAAEQAVLRNAPLVVAHESEVANPGDFATNSLSATPVLVVRQADGSVKAFVNLCRHRGSQVVMEPSGCERRFTCPYHAWSYKLDGSLGAIPNDDGFPSLDRSAMGLIPLACEVRHGLVWVMTDPAASIDVATFLGADLDDELSSWGLDGYRVERATTIGEDANWKLIVDGFLETYHLRFLHSATVGPYIWSNLGPFRAFGPHGRMAFVRSRYDASADDASQQFLRNVGAVYQIFPNTVLVWQSTHFERWTIFPHPTDPARSVTYVSLLAPAGQQDDGGMWDKNWKILLSTVQDEDWPVARATQAGFAAGAVREFVFGRNEPALQHFHQSLAAAAGGA